MTIYVDDPMPIGGEYGNWCHMWTDGPIEELHSFGESIGLKRSWFQSRLKFPHYDISPSVRKKAVHAGAVETSLRDFLIHPRTLDRSSKE